LHEEKKAFPTIPEQFSIHMHPFQNDAVRIEGWRGDMDVCMTACRQAILAVSPTELAF
jgi:hypothetical protein